MKKTKVKKYRIPIPPVNKPIESKKFKKVKHKKNYSEDNYE